MKENEATFKQIDSLATTQPSKLAANAYAKKINLFNLLPTEIAYKLNTLFCSVFVPLL